MHVLNTFAIDENISIKPISEEDNILLLFEVNIRPRKEVGGKARGVQREVVWMLED